MAGLMYRSVWLYEAAMIGLYGRHYASRYRAIADLIDARWSVVDLCCGPGILYSRYLAAKAVQYTGIDANERFVARVAARGARAIVRDLQQDEPLPAADCVVVQASLYHFLPEAHRLVDRMLAAARRRVIVTEPVRNLASSRSRPIAKVARLVSDAGRGPETHRFTERTLDELFARYALRVELATLIAGGREKLYALRP